jgi:hypothetical protein
MIIKKVVASFAFAASLIVTTAQAQFFSDDITVQQITMVHWHDSSACHSSVSPTYEIVVDSSFLNDTCRIVSQNGQLFVEVVNLTGATPWLISLSTTSYFTPDYVVSAGILSGNLPSVKIVTLHDTLYGVTASYNYPVPDACSYGMVSGRVYLDMNGNCTYDSGDDPLDFYHLEAQSVLNTGTTGLIHTIMNADGTYNIELQESWAQQYTINTPPLYSFIFPPTSCNPGSYTFTTVPQTGLDFALECSGNNDVTTHIGMGGVVRPNIPFMLYPGVSNVGCVAASGTLKLVLDPNVAYDPLLSSYPALYTSGDTLFWNYSNLDNISSTGYWNSFIAGIHLTPSLSVNIGDQLCFTVIADVPSSDVDPLNNTTMICLPVVNSYDPNMKEVSPAGTGTIGAIPPETEKLTYTIHFQNTGNAEAYDISVIDTLDTDLDPSTLRILATSHTMLPEWVSPGVVAFRFNNIHLADSTSNEPASHGFVTFEIALDAALPIGTVIENTGHIFFDFNDAIVTNTTVNTLSLLAGIQEEQSVKVTVFPNPASGMLTIEGEGIQAISLVDFSGKTVLKASVLTDSQLDVSALNNGIYLLHVETSRGRAIRKLVISH